MKTRNISSEGQATGPRLPVCHKGRRALSSLASQKRPPFDHALEDAFIGPDGSQRVAECGNRRKYELRIVNQNYFLDCAINAKKHDDSGNAFG